MKHEVNITLGISPHGHTNTCRCRRRNTQSATCVFFSTIFKISDISSPTTAFPFVQSTVYRNSQQPDSIELEGIER
jgi:hypothetical protein